MVARLLELLDVASLDPDGLERVDRRPDRLVACAGVVRGRLQLVGADGGCHCVSAPKESVERRSSARGQRAGVGGKRGEPRGWGVCLCAVVAAVVVRALIVDVSLAQSRSIPLWTASLCRCRLRTRILLARAEKKERTCCRVVCVDSFPADLERHRHEAAVRDRPQARLTYRESVPGAASAGGARKVGPFKTAL